MSTMTASPATPAGASSSERPAKRQKVAIACDVCRAKKVRCDGLRPVCSPCAKRADRGVPCEYTTETRTSHGPSKGYVHHLELKLRELQAEKDLPPSPNQATPPIYPPQPPLFNAINRPLPPDRTYSTAPPGFDPTQRQEGSTRRLSLPQVQPQLQLQSPGQSSAGFALGSNGVPGRTSPSPSPMLQNSGQGSSTAAQTTPRPGPVPFSNHKSQGPPDVFPPGRTPGPFLSSPRSVTEISSGPATGDFFSSKTLPPFVRQMRTVIDAKVPPQSPALAPSVASSPMLVMPTMQPKAQSAQPVDYVLPSRKTADSLLQTYWQIVHPLYPFLDRRSFEQAYAGIWSGIPSETDESLMMCTLNLVFALACQYSETTPPREREATAEKFFSRAQGLLNLDLWEMGSLQLIRCLLLMSQYLQKTRSPHQCWTVTGLTLRFAEGLSLHLPETSSQCHDVQQRESLRRLWHGCVMMDRLLSLQLNRPAAVDNLSPERVPLPLAVDDHYLDSGQPQDQPSPLSFFVHSLRLFDIMSRSLKTTSSSDARFSPGDHYGLLFGYSDAGNLAELLQLDQALSSWSRAIPVYLRVDARESRQNGVFFRQSNILCVRYLHSRILLFRPILARFCAPSNDLHSLVRQSLSYDMAFTSSTLCLCAAHELIYIIHTNLERETGLGPVPLWWNCLLYIYAAATVLQAARLQPELERSLPTYIIGTSWSHALDILRSFEQFGPISQRCVVALEILADKVSEALNPSAKEVATSQLQGSSSAAAAAGMTRQPSTFQGAMSASTAQTPALTPADVEAANAAIPGMGDALQMGASDFDLSDMSWLTTPPFHL